MLSFETRSEYEDIILQKKFDSIRKDMNAFQNSFPENLLQRYLCTSLKLASIPGEGHKAIVSGPVLKEGVSYTFQIFANPY